MSVLSGSTPTAVATFEEAVMKDIEQPHLSWDEWDELHDPRPEETEFDAVVASAMSRRGFLGRVLASRRSRRVHRGKQMTFYSAENIGKCPSAVQTLSTIGQAVALHSALHPFCLRPVCRWLITPSSRQPDQGWRFTLSLLALDCWSIK